METQSKKQATPKVLSSQYVVKVNGEQLPNSQRESLKLARDIVRGLTITDAIQKVEIVRQNVTETVINTFEPKATVSLVSVDDLGLE
jgi:sulfur carrier protein ThiS